MKQLTDKQMDALKSVSKHLYMASRLNCKHNTTKAENDLVADVLDYVTGGKVQRNYSCSVCVYNLYNRLGNIYLKRLKEMETTTTTVEEVETEVETVQQEKEPNQIINKLEPEVTETKNKRGRKPKAK